MKTIYKIIGIISLIVIVFLIYFLDKKEQFEDINLYTLENSFIIEDIHYYKGIHISILTNKSKFHYLKLFFENTKNSSELDIHFTEMNNAAQSEVSVAFTNPIKKTHPDYFPMLLGNRILGGVKKPVYF